MVGTDSYRREIFDCTKNKMMGATGRQQMQNNAMSLLDFQPKGLKNNSFNCRVRNSFPVYKMTECSGTVD